MNRYRISKYEPGLERTGLWLLEVKEGRQAPWTTVDRYDSRVAAKAAEHAAFQREIVDINKSIRVTHTGTTGE
jgi:hypothetical protein